MGCQCSKSQQSSAFVILLSHSTQWQGCCELTAIPHIQTLYLVTTEKERKNLYVDFPHLKPDDLVFLLPPGVTDISLNVWRKSDHVETRIYSSDGRCSLTLKFRCYKMEGYRHRSAFLYCPFMRQCTKHSTDQPLHALRRSAFRSYPHAVSKSIDQISCTQFSNYLFKNKTTWNIIWNAFSVDTKRQKQYCFTRTIIFSHSKNKQTNKTHLNPQELGHFLASNLDY